MRESILVLGIGNPLLGDEGVGPRAVAQLARDYRFPEQVELLDGGTAGLSLAAHASPFEKWIVLDAVRVGALPGTLVQLDGSQLPADFAGKISPHEIGLGEILAAARLQGGPSEVVILGIEPKRVGLGWELSEVVTRALPKLVERAVRQLAEWGVEVGRAGEPLAAAAGLPGSPPGSLC